MTTTNDSPTLPAPLRGLLRAEAFPHAVDTVVVIQTQLSWVVLAGAFAYKIKRPVRYPFVDFTRLADREHFCREELRLNRRFAPELYVEVCAITGEGENARIGGPGPVSEYAVVLRRFDRGEELDRLVLEDRVSGSELLAFGQSLALIHTALPQSAAVDGGQPVAIAAAMARNVAECMEASALFGTGPRIAALGRALAAECVRLQDALAQRLQSGRVRECHGDLHLSNVVRLHGRLVPFDCLEFRPDFRHIDVAQDVAFLTADLQGYQRPRLATALLNGWLAASGDYAACAVLRLYEADRALVRAKVMALVADTRPRPDASRLQVQARRHADYLAVAEQALTPPAPRCVMMHGLPASGKSWLAARLAEEFAAVHIRSDIERKRLAGLRADESSHSTLAGGLYAAEQTERVYAQLAEQAATVLAGQRSVIVDANFGLRQQRARLAAVCRRLGVPLQVVSCEAPLPVLRERIRLRQAQGSESEADARVLEHQLQQREAIDAGEALQVVRADTTQPDLLAYLTRVLRQRAAE